MKGRTPSSAEKKHMNLVGVMPCIACEKDGYYNDYVSLHHVDGRVKPDAHFEVLPLCAFHHQHDDSDPWQRIGIHPYKARFEKLYGTSDELLNELRLRIERQTAMRAEFFTAEQIDEWELQSESEQAAHQKYVARKKQWDEQNPNATPRQRDLAVNQISEELGI